MDKMHGILGKIYYCILWWFGAALSDEELDRMKGGGDRWTYWFRRHKKRVGWFFWIEVAGGFGGAIWLVLHIVGLC